MVISEVNIICDASFDPHTQVATYAAEAYVNGKIVRSKGLLDIAISSTNAELMAINESLIACSNYLKLNDISTSRVNVYTDSQRGIDLFKADKYQYNLLSNTKSNASIKDNIKKTISMMAVKLNMHKVKAHQRDVVATPIERRHNIVDQLALSLMREYRDTIIKPNRLTSPFVGVILPSTFESSEENALHDLGYNLVNTGETIRYTTDNIDRQISPSHPFLSGASIAAQENKLDLHDVCFNMRLSRANGKNINDINIGCKGLDKAIPTLINNRSNEAQGVRRKLNYTSYSLQNAGAASRLLYGEQDVNVRYKGRGFVRESQASKCVINMSCDSPDESVIHWLKIIADEIKTPYYSNELMYKQSLDNSHLRLLDIVNEVIQQYGEQLDPKQLISKIKSHSENEGLKIPSMMHKDRVNNILKEAVSFTTNTRQRAILSKNVFAKPALNVESLKGDSPHREILKNVGVLPSLR
ncbi:MAG: hypothetical protein HAW67_04400 [Endozoicomonadaceae bacterium]|nr:hypothetical protein [Endozoicomonadaceae bacterium]